MTTQTTQKSGREELFIQEDIQINQAQVQVDSVFQGEEGQREREF